MKSNKQKLDILENVSNPSDQDEFQIKARIWEPYDTRPWWHRWIYGVN